MPLRHARTHARIINAGYNGIFRSHCVCFLSHLHVTDDHAALRERIKSYLILKHGCMHARHTQRHDACVLYTGKSANLKSAMH